MMTNVYAESDEHGVELRFRIVALIGKRLTSTGSYYDKLVKLKTAGVLSPVCFKPTSRQT